jgi:sugar/nucleoside kinase (ribokinase family)
MGANARLTESDVSDALLVRSRLLHIGGAFLMPGLDGEPLARLLERAKKLGLETSLDTAFNPDVDAKALIVPCLPHLDIFFPSIEEATAITGRSDTEEIFDWLEDFRVPVVGVKLGQRGCAVREKGKTTFYPAYPVDVVDGSGAGDAFMAGYLYGVLEGWSVADSARFGNATAAHCIQAIGCSSGIRLAAAIGDFMKSHRPW